jgi:hypothetical protein
MAHPTLALVLSVRRNRQICCGQNSAFRRGEIVHMRFHLASLLLLPILAALTSPVAAGTTGWMTSSQLLSHAKSKMTGKYYGTAIDCKNSKNGPLLNLTHAAFPAGYKPMTGNDKFYRWNFVVAESSSLKSTISKIRRKDRLELKWRVVGSKTYKNSSGVEMTCALLYR